MDTALDEVTSRKAPLVRSPRQIAAQEKAQEGRDLALARSKVQQEAARLAQVVNLHIAGFSLADIGAQIGASADEIDRMLTADTARYVRNQPALRTFVRNWVSERYSKLLDTVWDAATDKDHGEMLEHQDRAVKLLDRMARLHGAEMPVQKEVTIDAAPDAVERMVAALSAAKGMAYDATIFDIVDAEVVHEIAAEAHDHTVVSGNRVEEPDESDEDF